VDLTNELDQFVRDEVDSGRYEDAGDVIRAALQNLEQEERAHEAATNTLRTAIEAGDSSGIAEGDIFARIREKLALQASH
jgi:antitoxin ParD1/3/4